MDYDLNWLVTDYGKFLEKFGLDENSVRQHYAVWKEKSGSDSARDYLWYLFQVILGETAKQVTNETDLLKNNLELYSAMWFFQTHIEGQLANELQQLVNETKTKLWLLQLPYHFHIKLTGEDCCSYCNQFHGQLLAPNELLGHEVFSTLHCTSQHGCTCVPSPVADRDASNRIILKESTAN